MSVGDIPGLRVIMGNRLPIRSVLCSKTFERTGLDIDPSEAAIRPYPYVPLSVFGQRSDEISWKRRWVGRIMELMNEALLDFIETVQSAVSAYPYPVMAVDHQADYPGVCESAWITRERSYVFDPTPVACDSVHS